MLGLRDGQSVAFRGYGLTPGASYSVRTCDLLAVSCGADQAVVVADRRRQGGRHAHRDAGAGPVRGLWPAVPRPAPRRRRWRAGAHPRLHDPPGHDRLDPPGRPGRRPDRDGDRHGPAADVHGHAALVGDRWVVAWPSASRQCWERSSTSAGAFTKCGVPPGGGTVTVGADGTFTAHGAGAGEAPEDPRRDARLHARRASPASLTLLRYEQDGTVSRRIATMSFVS